MIISEIAKKYSDSLFDCLNEYENIYKDLNLINSTFESSKELFELLSNPTIDIDVKNNIVDDVFKDHINLKVLNFLKILVENGNVCLFGEIVSAFLAKKEASENIKHIKIISAIDLNAEYKDKIIERLSFKMNKTIIPEWVTDNSIIGGLIIKSDDEVIDSSIKTKLNRMMKGNI